MLVSIFAFLLFFTSVFMILLILIQRGKGGGLAGAFGGMGGQSAFGTKAGDTFTKITVVTAVIWFILGISTILILKGGSSKVRFGDGDRPASQSVTTEPASGETSSGDTGAATESPAPTSTPSAPTSEPAN